MATLMIRVNQNALDSFKVEEGFDKTVDLLNKDRQFVFLHREGVKHAFNRDAIMYVLADAHTGTPQVNNDQPEAEDFITPAPTVAELEGE